LSGCNLSNESSKEPDEPAPVQSVAPPTEASVVHLTQPGELPQNQAGHAGDYDSSISAREKRAAGGDRFTFGRFERPFNADTMDVYFPELDIVDTFVYQDDTWIYGVLTLRGFDENKTLSGIYGVEFEMTLDGKGDWLLLVDNPSSEEWTTDGVRVYRDSNKDVGGLSAMFTDDPPVYSDGFETIVFDSGMGDDPDLAWVRISPDNPLTLHFAIKKATIDDGDGQYMVNMWTGREDLDSALFDHNDHFTHEEAGAADKGLEYFYPIKQLSELDNSCRMAVGFQPTGHEPGLCPLPGAAPEEGCKGPPINGCGAYPNFWNPANCSCDQYPPPI